MMGCPSRGISAIFNTVCQLAIENVNSLSQLATAAADCHAALLTVDFDFLDLDRCVEIVLRQHFAPKVGVHFKVGFRNVKVAKIGSAFLYL